MIESLSLEQMECARHVCREMFFGQRNGQKPYTVFNEMVSAHPEIAHTMRDEISGMVALGCRGYLFYTGPLVGTPAAMEAVEAAGIEARVLVDRHGHGDWGVEDPEDVGLNNAALERGSRLLSAYTLSTGVVVWLITDGSVIGGEEDKELNRIRYATTLLLPNEY